MRRALLGLALAALMALAACVGHEYQITTSDGGKYLTDEMPEYVAETNTYRFTDVNGTEQEIKRQRIVDIKTERVD